MKLTPEKYMALSEMYLMEGIGRKVHGLVHNLNNLVHVVDMQLSMLSTKSQTSADTPIGSFREKISRSSGGTSKIVQSLQKSGHFSFFTQKHQAQINIPEFITWLLEFWENDLFFKHKVKCLTSFEDAGINLSIPPFHLTLCLEQGIRNALEACQGMDESADYVLNIDVNTEGQGLRISLTSPTMIADLDPWAEGSSSKDGHLGMGLPVCSFVASRLGWNIELNCNGQETEFSVSIPGSKSVDQTVR